MAFDLRTRSGRSNAADSAEALRCLAALLRSGSGLRTALANWHWEAPGSLGSSLSRLSRLLKLGAPIEHALSAIQADLGSEAPALPGVIAAHMKLGGDLAQMLDSLARGIEQRRALFEAARASVAGAVLSGRIVAGLPLLFLLFAPSARAPFNDALGLVTLGFGAALGIGGLVWIARLVPSPDALDDPASSCAEVAAALLAGGSGLLAALDVVSRSCPMTIRPAFDRARRLVGLGVTWPEALTSCGDSSLRELASCIRRASTLGVPIAKPLEEWAASRRARLARDFEASMRKAPVLMVVPLTVCVLPSYLVLSLGPFLRSL